MATWSSFAVTAAQMRAKEPSILSSMSDAEVIALFQTQAKTEMEFDLLDSAQIVDSTDSDFEAVLTDHLIRLQEALCYKQLGLYYESLGGEMGSLNRYRADTYKQKYIQASRGFGQMMTSSSPRAEFMTFTR